MVIGSIIFRMCVMARNLLLSKLPLFQFVGIVFTLGVNCRNAMAPTTPP